MRNCLIFILFILSNLQHLQAQQPAYFLFGQSQFEGIDIYNIIQDFEHNYWFATDQGLYVHDGYRFDKIECEDMKAHSVFNFTINSRGVIYCNNLSQQVFKIENGICTLIFDIPDTGTDLHLAVNHKDELYITTSRKVYVLNENYDLIHTPEIPKVWSLGPPFLLESGAIIQHVTSNSQLLVYSDGSSHFQSIDHVISANEGDEVLHFFQMGNSTYGINNLSKDIYKVDLANYSTENTNRKIDTETALLRYYPIENSLWVSNSISGIFLVNDRLERTHKSAKIFNDYFISFVYKDQEGNVLLATFDQGIIVIPHVEIQDVVPEFANYKVTRIIKDAENELYFGTRDGGILKYDGELSIISESSNKSVEYMFYWPGEQLILEDTKNLTVHSQKGESTSLKFGSLKDALQVSENELLLALNSGLLKVRYDSLSGIFQKDSVLVSERTYAVAQEINSRRTYVSTASGLRYKDEKSDYQLLTHNERTISVFDLEAHEDKVFAASSRHGILVLQKGEVMEEINPIYNKTPLTLFKIIIGGDRIYANTQIGLVILDMNGQIINFLNKSNGLTANKIIDFELFNDQLWVTHARGIQRFNLSEISSKVEQPSISIRNILINNHRIEDVVEKGEFNSDQRNFKFSFYVPTLRHRENIRYHFKLEEDLKDWVINNYENHEVEYNALAPGDYRFIVKAENNGVFSDPLYYSFSISAPYYLRWWFLALITLAGVLLISAVYIRQLNIHKKKAQQVLELNTSRLTAIQSQMNPHFIFNSLNSIQDLVLKGDINNSYTFITKFSNLVRRTLNYSDKDFIDFDEEIKLIELYLSLEKLRFKEDLKYSLETNNIEDIKIPPMLIQPFIENALVHGLLHKTGAKQLDIRFTLGDVLICEITDNGIGREKALEIKSRHGDSHESFAVNAIKLRFNILMDHHQGKLGFKMEDVLLENEVTGTKVTLRIPVQPKF